MEIKIRKSLEIPTKSNTKILCTLFFRLKTSLKTCQLIHKIEAGNAINQNYISFSSSETHGANSGLSLTPTICLQTDVSCLDLVL